MNTGNARKRSRGGQGKLWESGIHNRIQSSPRQVPEFEANMNEIESSSDRQPHVNIRNVCIVSPSIKSF